MGYVSRVTTRDERDGRGTADDHGDEYHERDHRGDEFKEIFGRVRDGLEWLFETDDEVLTVTASGTGAFEAGMTNFSSRSDTLICIGGGKFGQRWGDVADSWEMDVVDVEVEWGTAVDLERLEAALEAHPDTAMVTLTASETSTGVLHPVEEVAELVHRKSDALLAVDGITAVGVHPLPMDAWNIDVLVAGSQKAFGVPPGLGFVAANDRAWERYDRADDPGYYFDLGRERGRQVHDQTAFTPAIPQVLAMEEVLKLMREEGRDGIFRRHERNARATRAAVRALDLEVFGEPHSNAVTAVRTPDDLDAPAVVDTMADKHGAVIAGGQKHLSPNLFRLGHIGFFDHRDILHMIGALELSLAEVGLPVQSGQGVEAAQSVFADFE
ncbi:MAG: alanine--glyoxylate aminotransferase family protein [Bradymonadaceae bacterium]